MNQNTYDMKSSENNSNTYLNVNMNNLQYYNSKIGKENKNSLTYKLRELQENQNRIKMNNDNNYNPSLNNSNSNMTINTQLTNQSKYFYLIIYKCPHIFYMNVPWVTLFSKY